MRSHLGSKLRLTMAIQVMGLGFQGFQGLGDDEGDTHVSGAWAKRRCVCQGKV